MSPLLVLLTGPLAILAVIVVAACLSRYDYYYESKNNGIPSGVASFVAFVFVVIIAVIVSWVLHQGGVF